MPQPSSEGRIRLTPSLSSNKQRLLLHPDPLQGYLEVPLLQHLSLTFSGIHTALACRLVITKTDDISMALIAVEPAVTCITIWLQTTPQMPREP